MISVERELFVGVSHRVPVATHLYPGREDDEPRWARRQQGEEEIQHRTVLHDGVGEDGKSEIDKIAGERTHVAFAQLVLAKRLGSRLAYEPNAAAQDHLVDVVTLDLSRARHEIAASALTVDFPAPGIPDTMTHPDSSTEFMNGDARSGRSSIANGIVPAQTTADRRRAMIAARLGEVKHDGPVNARFELAWYNVQSAPGDFCGSRDLAAPIIDEVPLFELLPGDLWPGLRVEWVCPPSRHWLGEAEYFGSGRPVILDAECGEIDCCGVVAEITLTPEAVTWSNFYSHGTDEIPVDVTFTFDRRKYEEAILTLPSAPRVAWSYPD